MGLCALVDTPYFDRRKLAGYPEEILSLEKLCWGVKVREESTKIHDHGKSQEVQESAKKPKKNGKVPKRTFVRAFGKSNWSSESYYIELRIRSV